MRAAEVLLEAIQMVKLAPQLFAPHPKQISSDFTITENFALKPPASRWTSTARQTDQGFTSAWVEWALSEMPGWVGEEGILYNVSPGANILVINSDQNAVEIAQHYGVEIKNQIDLFTRMPWELIAKDYDAVNHKPVNRSSDIYMRSWDVESTAWFNTNVLINPKKVVIDRPVKSAAPDKKQPRYMSRRRR